MNKYQEKAIETQRARFLRIHPDATFRTWTPKSSGTLRLVALYKVPSYGGTEIPYSQAWTIGPRGKVSSG